MLAGGLDGGGNTIAAVEVLAFNGTGFTPVTTNIQPLARAARGASLMEVNGMSSNDVDTEGEKRRETDTMEGRNWGK